MMMNVRLKSRQESDKNCATIQSPVQRQPLTAIVDNRPASIRQRKVQVSITNTIDQVVQRQLSSPLNVAQFGKNRKNKQKLPVEVTELNQRMSDASLALKKAEEAYDLHKDNTDLGDPDKEVLRRASWEARGAVEMVEIKYDMFEGSLKVPVGGSKPPYFTNLEKDHKAWLLDVGKRLGEVEQKLFSLTDSYKNLDIDDLDDERPGLMESLIMRGKLTVNQQGYWKSSGQSRAFNETKDWTLHLHRNVFGTNEGHYKPVDDEFSVGYKATNPVSSRSLRRLGVNGL